MSQHIFQIGTDKLERLHAEAADRRDARLASPRSWVGFVRWIGDRFDRA